MKVFERFESCVRSYSRSFPTIFSKAKGYKLWDIHDQEYIDFFAGAGALNYGHNNPRINRKLISFIENDGIVHSLDMATTSKEQFLERFFQVILEPRKLDYRVMFPGPTGTNSVESALKIARKVTGRHSVVAFTNAFHGMTLGSLAMTGNSGKRGGAGLPLTGCIRMPYDGYLGEGIDTANYLENTLEDRGSGIDIPAAILLETIQAEGGLNIASIHWLKHIQAICQRWNILLIVDDIQVGCGRTGPFFSFEAAGLDPDVVCLSKSVGGSGLPMALTLIKPKYDIWEPGEHNGTFRGNNLAFVAATEALSYWEDNDLAQEVHNKGEQVSSILNRLVVQYPDLQANVRGRGLIQGLECGVKDLSKSICQAAFKRGLIVETSGVMDQVIKILPPLTIDQNGLERGLAILADSIDASLKIGTKQTTEKEVTSGLEFPAQTNPKPIAPPQYSHFGGLSTKQQTSSS
jgi:diaminobutyrate-2-oxoglutarate transaminase